jgi:hypothetical protein
MKHRKNNKNRVLCDSRGFSESKNVRVTNRIKRNLKNNPLTLSVVRKIIGSSIHFKSSKCFFVSCISERDRKPGATEDKAVSAPVKRADKNSSKKYKIIFTINPGETIINTMA